MRVALTQRTALKTIGGFDISSILPDSAKKVDHDGLMAVGTVGAQSAQTCLEIGVRTPRAFLRRLPSCVLHDHSRHNGSILAQRCDYRPERWTSMTDHLGECSIPCIAHVIRSSCTINGCLVHVPEVRRGGRRLIPQTLRRCHPTSMCSRQLHNTRCTTRYLPVTYVASK